MHAFRQDVDAGVVRNLSQVLEGKTASFAIDDSGQEVVAIAGIDPLGTNPEHLYQIFSFATLTGDATQLTSFPGGLTNARQAIGFSDDRQWIAFLSHGDHVGTNHDRSMELFVMRRDGSSLAQLSHDPAPNGGSVSRVRLAGSGNRIAFTSNSDPLGSNPNRTDQLFVIDRDGTALTQLTPSVPDGSIYDLSISDDGARIAFSSSGDLLGSNTDGNPELFAIEHDGSNLRQVSSSATESVQRSFISGNGLWIAIEVFPSPTNMNLSEVRKLAWDGTNLTTIGPGIMPVMDDTGSNVWTGFSGLDHTASGNGLMRVYGADDLTSVRTNGAGLLELVVPDVTFYHTDLAANATTVVFASEADVLGTNPNGWDVIYTLDMETETIAQVNSPPALVADFPAIADNGTIAFVSVTNLTTGGVGVLEPGISGPTQILDCPSSGTFPGVVRATDISRDGTLIVFTGDCDPLGQNADLGPELFLIGPDGSSLQQLTSGTTGRQIYPRLDADGTWVVFDGDIDPLGLNPDGWTQVFRARTDGSSIQQLTSYTDASIAFSSGVDVSDDGGTVAYVSRGDELGTNPNRHPQVLTWDAASGLTRQLTLTSGAGYRNLRLSRDGSHVYVSSGFQFTDDDPDTFEDLYRVRLADSTIERVGGLALDSGRSSLGPLAVGTDDRIVALAADARTPDNPDQSNELLLIDFAERANIEVSGPAPTLLQWDVEPGQIRYDVIRGDLANLTAFGSTIDLGPVICLEDDSPDVDTVGNEDLDDPLPGEVFFYARRGTQGTLAGPGTYGSSSTGLERVAGAGDCP